MKFKELLSKYRWDDIQTALVRLYPDQAESLEGCKQVFETLQTTRPVETKMRISIENVLDEYTGEYYAVVSGKDGTLKKDSNPEIFKDDEVGNQEVTYGIEFTDWAEWLGMEIDPETLSSYSEVDIIGHCLWEMTFFGYSQQAIKAKIDEMAQSKRSGKGLTLAELERELGL